MQLIIKMMTYTLTISTVLISLIVVDRWFHVINSPRVYQSQQGSSLRSKQTYRLYLLCYGTVTLVFMIGLGEMNA